MYKAIFKCQVFISTPSSGKSVNVSGVVRNKDATIKLEYSLPWISGNV